MIQGQSDSANQCPERKLAINVAPTTELCQKSLHAMSMVKKIVVKPLLSLFTLGCVE